MEHEPTSERPEGIAALPRDIVPQAMLETRTVAALRTAGLLHGGRRPAAA
jgi:hypothetical protein